MKFKLKKPSKKLVKRIVIIGLVAAVGGWFFLKPILMPAQKVLPTLSVKEIGASDVTSSLATTGTIKSDDIRTYYAPIGGKVSSVGVELGEMVEQGAMMVTFDQSDLARQYEKAKLSYDNDYYKYQETKEDYEDIDDKATSADTRLKKAKEKLEDAQDETSASYSGIKQLNETLGKLQAELAAKQEDDKWKKANSLLNIAYAQLDDLLTNDPNSPEIPNKRTDVRTKEEALFSVEKDLKINNTKDEIASTERAIEKAEAAAGQAELAEQQAEANVDTARAGKNDTEDEELTELKEKQLDTSLEISKLTLEEIKDNYAKAQQGLSAEITGVVTALEAEEGGQSASGQRMVEISSKDKVKVQISLTRYDLEAVAVGQKAKITFAGQPYEGVVTKIAESVLETEYKTSNNTTATTQPTLLADVEISNPDEFLKLGLEASVTIITAEKTGVMVVPVEAVITDKDGDFCWVAVDGKAAKKYVTTGVSSDLEMEIVSGLELGDLVIYSPPDDIYEGMELQTTLEDLPPAQANMGGMMMM